MSNFINNLKTKKEEKDLVNAWKEIMVSRRVYNSKNETFTINDLLRTEYGWRGRIYSPVGLDFKQLDDLIGFIESGLKCDFQYSYQESNKYVAFSIKYPIDTIDEISFKPLNVKPYEMFAGIDCSGNIVTISSLGNPHMLIAGSTRTGKSKYIEMQLESILNSCNEKEFNLYIFSLNKLDLMKYKDYEQTKAFVVRDLVEISKELLNIKEEIIRREDLMGDMLRGGLGKDIFDYNKLSPESKLAYITVIFEELSELLADYKNKDTIDSINNSLGFITQNGSSVGVNLIASMISMSGKSFRLLENLVSTKMCFRVNDPCSSELFIGNERGIGLREREAICRVNGDTFKVYMPVVRQNIEI